ncbi:MAG: efflux transporter outer membrane subunit [Gammaproteobacteria bacterium]|jgi:multidrug efflux system outer membrane protein|nr:efflux transporter outer membrane subunit [Gammaproteobacteria bacterium]MDH5173428.1 efflux transporter outer membrane subunit [Gammaproteobacteria bacterium]
MATDIKSAFRFASRTAIAAIWPLVLGGCMLGPDYRRPEVPEPATFRGVEGQQQAESIADANWSTVAQDPVLEELIRVAIANNLDLRTATARVTEARARYGIAQSFMYPEVGATGGYSSQQDSRLADLPQGSASDSSYENWNAGIQVSWELDLFGRIRRESEAAFAQYLATEQGQRAVLVSLVGDVASNYLLMRQLDLELEIARQTVVSNEETVRFYRNRLEGGLSNRLELDTAVANLARTSNLIPQLERQIAVTENALSLLLGRPPGPIERGDTLSARHMPASVPLGLPASLLERRPDVQAAEQQLVAANAQVGAAKALFFPRISLTGLYGSVSGDFSDLMNNDAEVWSVNPSLFAPVFQGGRISRNYEASKAVYEQAFAQYHQSALNAYREVANALVALRSFGDSRVVLQSGVDALQDAAALSRLRYEAGLASYLEILNADQQLLDQRILLAEARGGELRAFVELYRALGGGWQ